MINAKQLRLLVIRPTLQAMNMWSESAEELLIGTAAQESLLGHFIKQVGGGPAVSIYQIEPATASDIVHRYLNMRRGLDKQFQSAFQLVNSSQIDWEHISIDQVELKLISDLRFATAIARLRYWMVPETLPAAGDLSGMATYWKKHFNTVLGAGTEAEYIHNYQRLVVGE